MQYLEVLHNISHMMEQGTSMDDQIILNVLFLFGKNCSTPLTVMR